MVDAIQIFMDSFEIPEARQKEIEDICHEICHTGDIVDNLKKMRMRFSGDELAYVMWRMGVNTGSAYAAATGRHDTVADW